MPDVVRRSNVEILDNFIGGRWVSAQTNEFFDVHNPAVGDVIGRTPLSTGADVDAAVRAATDAFPAWRDTPVNARAQRGAARGGGAGRGAGGSGCGGWGGGRGRSAEGRVKRGGGGCMSPCFVL